VAQLITGRIGLEPCSQAHHGTDHSEDTSLNVINSENATGRGVTWQPGQPVPVRANRPTSAALVTHFYFPISPRTLERWPLTVRRPNKVAIYEVEELMRIAEQKLNAACAYKQAEACT